MSDACCEVKHDRSNLKFRKVLWIALILNLAMFIAEFSASFYADSVSLKADSIDFIGDAFNYGISLYVLGHSIKKKSYCLYHQSFKHGYFWNLGDRRRSL